MSHYPKIRPLMRVNRESLSEAGARGVISVTPASDSGLFRRPELPGCEGPFHFTHRMGLLCADICQRVPELSHIDPLQVLVTFIQCRGSRSWGLQARLVPLRFKGGRFTDVRQGHRYRIQQIVVGSVEIRYVLSFYLPRFLNQSFDEKLITVFHELYHISPLFDGDIRRFEETSCVHGGCQRSYDRHMADLARRYLRGKPSPALLDFLRLSFDELQCHFQSIVGLHIPTPKLIPIEKED